ncbi:MAG TPA: F0F1 ATP synthase subunit delta [Gammaproteobacteria bacterium]|jgi:F-type H+-transporting ATPase subunit delta|nr:F0F1 ATP synthase subunit delta [Gammaproteobacteria bacterium]
MANLSNIARPYAQAAFECARDQQQIAEWKAFLMSAATVSRNHSVQRLLADPERTPASIYKLFEEVLESVISAEQKNLLLLLSQNRRLDVLPEITDAYNAYVAAFEKICTARVVTAVSANDDFRQKVARALTIRTQREVNLVCEVDPGIIGGAIIHLGDRVIDGSVRGKLTRLLEFSLR